MRIEARLLSIGLLLSVMAVIGCQLRAQAEQLFADAEVLRVRHDKAASEEAIRKYREAVAAWTRRDEERQAAIAAQRLGETLGHLGLLRESLQAYEDALSLADQAGDPLLESEIRSDVGIARSLAGDVQDEGATSLRECELSLALARQAGGVGQEAKALNCLGEVAYNQGERERALALYQRAQVLWDRVGDTRGQAETLLYQGSVYSDQSEFDRARDCYDRATMLWASVDDTRGIAMTLVLDARLRLRQGDYQEALNRFTQAQVLLEKIGDAVWEAASLTGLGTVYLHMADTASAVSYWERSLELFERAGLTGYSVDVLLSLGETYLIASDDITALNRFERALALATEMKNPHWEAYALRFIGLVNVSREQPAQAIRYFERSLDVQRQFVDPHFEAQTRADMGEAHALLGDREAAVDYFDQALTQSTALGDRATEARALLGLARTALGQGDLDAARTDVERSLEAADSLRASVESRDLRTSYFASVHEYYELQVDVLMRLDEAHPKREFTAAAFAASEQARARSLLESLAEAHVDLRSGVDSELLDHEEALAQAFDEWAMRSRNTGPADDARARELADEYRALEEDFDRLQAEIRSKSPRYAALTQPMPLSLVEVQKQVLDADTLLLEYALGDERSYLWAVSATGQSSFTLPPRAEIEQAAERVYALLTMRLTTTGDLADRQRRGAEADAEYWTEAARLSDTLLGPTAPILAGKRVILVVADGALQYLPFAALPIPGRPGEAVPMVVEHEVVHLPSASVLAVVRRETADRKLPAHSVAVLADPVFEPDDPRLQNATTDGSRQGQPSGIFPFLRDGQAGVPPRLAATRQEAKAILDRAPDGREWTGLDASRATAMSSELGQYRIVHFATHGFFDNENPGLSGVLLSMFDAEGQPQDGFLRLRDIYGLRLPAELVVLSACNTALGKQVRGEGLVGIVRGFMYAGAKRVVASLWKVDDEATRELMTHFYRHMFDDQRSPAAALREAQVEMWQQDRWRSPFYWAAFVLQGEWR